MKIEHVALYVLELDEAKNFFCKYFGGAADEGYYNVNTGFKSFFVTFGDGTRLELMTRPETLRAQQSLARTSFPTAALSMYQRGWAHIAFAAGSRAAVDRLAAELERDGYEILSGPGVTGDGYYECCVCGFEGNLIAITV